jgi:hypothetical protein
MDSLTDDAPSPKKLKLTRSDTQKFYTFVRKPKPRVLNCSILAEVPAATKENIDLPADFVASPETYMSSTKSGSPPLASQPSPRSPARSPDPDDGSSKRQATR